jgi:hypothetical protein
MQDRSLSSRGDVLASRRTPTDPPATEAHFSSEDTHLDVHQGIGGVSVAELDTSEQALSLV